MWTDKIEFQAIGGRLCLFGNAAAATAAGSPAQRLVIKLCVELIAYFTAIACLLT